LDLRRLAFSLTNGSYSLESACAAFGVSYTKRKVVHGEVTADYVDYCREDVHATFQLAVALLDEYDRHPISPDHEAGP